MQRIALLSDTHYKLDKRLLPYLKTCDQIWHAGDIGSIEIIDKLNKIAKTKAVYGNIDNHKIRSILKHTLLFDCEQIKVMITHIGGYPKRYTKDIKNQLKKSKPNLFICGHSHILRVMYDKELDILHMNPGACGDYGQHKVKTMIRFCIDKKEIKELEIVEIPRN